MEHIQVWWIWLGIAVAFAVGEMVTAGFFLLWFGIAAVVACVLAALGVSTAWQWGAFVTVSAGLLVASRPLAEKFTKQQPPGVGADRVVGEQGVVIESIDNINNTGRVRVGKDEWRADSDAGQTIASGQRVEVLRTDGTHLVVKAIEEAA